MKASKLALAALLMVVSPAVAQWQVPNNTIPIGRGPGVVGFNSLTTSANGILSTNSAGVPSITNIITGQNYLSAMTNTGEAFGYSFRNSTVTGTSIYTPINVTTVNLQDGLQSVLVVPSTATVDAANGIGIYFQNNSTAHIVNTVGLFAVGMGTTTNAPIWGINTLLQDNATRATHTRTGQYVIGWEADFQIMGANTTVLGMTVGLGGLTQPSAATAITINGQISPDMKWSGGFVSSSGAVSGPGLQLGSTSLTGTSVGSQPIQLLYWNAASALKTFSIIALNSVLTVVSNETNSQLQLGVAGQSHGSLTLQGGGSGAVTILPQVIAGTPTLTLPNASGTLVATASAPLVINATTGNLTLTATGTGSAVLANSPTLSGGPVTMINNSAGGLTFQAQSSDTGQTYFTVGNSSAGGKTWQFATEGSGQADPGGFYFYDGVGYRFGISSSGGVILGAAPVSGQTLGSLVASAYLKATTYVQSGAVAVAGLPTCNAGAKASRYFVTDSNAASYTAAIGAVVAAGGTTNVPVVCDGTNWRVGANDNIPAHFLRKFA